MFLSYYTYNLFKAKTICATNHFHLFPQIWTLLYVLMIVTSVLTLAMETHEHFRLELHTYNESSRANATNQKKYVREYMEPHPGLAQTELIISSVFGANLLLRFTVCPKKLNFVKSFMNWIDFAVVLSQWAMFGELEDGFTVVQWLVGRFSMRTPTYLYGDPHYKDHAWERFIFIMGIPIMVRWHLYTESAPCRAAISWRSNYIHHKVRNEITYPFPHFNSGVLGVCKWMTNLFNTWMGIIIHAGIKVQQC